MMETQKDGKMISYHDHNATQDETQKDEKMIMIDYHRNTTQDEDASNSANNEVVMQTMNEFVLQVNHVKRNLY